MLKNSDTKANYQYVIVRQIRQSTPWHTERHGYDPTSLNFKDSILLDIKVVKKLLTVIPIAKIDWYIPIGVKYFLLNDSDNT